MRQRILWILLCAFALVGAATFGFAQGTQKAPPLGAETVISGPDVGIRVESRANGIVRGHIVVKVNGDWMPLELTMPPGSNRVLPVTMR